jgi:DNA replication protein DnaC
LIEREEERERKRQKIREVKALLDAEDPDDQLEAKPRRERVTIEEANVMRDSLKDDQRWMYNLITGAIEGQAQRDLAAQNADAICEFLTGVGGTGKSALIGAIRAWLTCRFESNRSVCVVSAPTGIAAKNIHGYTIHSILSFEVQQGGIGQYLPLIDRKRSTIASQMKEVRLLILDECSMFSNVMLLKLKNR